MPKIHTIHTKRLIIRTHQIRDAAALLHLNTNPTNNVFDPSPPDKQGRPKTLQRYESDIPKWRTATEKNEYAFMVITLPGDGSDGPLGQRMKREVLVGDDGEITQDVVIGMSGFNELVWRTKPHGGEPTKPQEGLLVGDIGALIDAPLYVKKGYAKEALVALVDYGFTTMGCDALVASTLAINTPFRALMKSIGFGHGIVEEQSERHGIIVPEAIYELTKEEWQRWNR